MKAKNNFSKFIAKIEQKMLETNKESLYFSINKEQVIGGMNSQSAND